MIDIRKLITDEKYNLELKEKVDFEEPKNYLKAVSSFSNGNDIGYLIFGIEDQTKSVVGIENVKESYEEITKRIKDRIEPRIVPIIDIVEYEEKQLIIVKVLPGENTPYYYVNKGTHIAYVRDGDQDVQANNMELNELILKGKNIGWDELLRDDKDLTFNDLKKHFKDLKNMDITDKDLESFELIKNGKYTNAASLFSDQNKNIQSFISCTRWEGKDKIIAKADEEYYGGILSQIDRAVEFIDKYMYHGWIRNAKKSLAHTDVFEYDLEAVREGIINAVAHRDYLSRGTQVEVDMYDDRLDIFSDGRLYGISSIDELLDRPTSKRRNSLVCDIFARLGLMERRGSGIKKIKDAYADDKVKPKFEINGTSFDLIFYSRWYKENGNYLGGNEDTGAKNEEINEEINETEKAILNEIKKNNNITQGELAQKLSIPNITIYRSIEKLKEKGIIERTGARKNGYWKVKKL